MGLYAEIVAIGPFSPDIAKCLNYPPEFYRTTKTGAQVITNLFGIVEGTSAGRAFAECLGITDPWDFNQHYFDGHKIDVDGIKTLFGTLGGGDEYLEHLERFLILRDHQFRFFYVPNG